MTVLPFITQIRMKAKNAPAVFHFTESGMANRSSASVQVGAASVCAQPHVLDFVHDADAAASKLADNLIWADEKASRESHLSGQTSFQ